MEAWDALHHIRTEHVAIFILLGPFGSDVARETEEDDDSILGREGVGVETPNAGETSAAMKFMGEVDQFGAEVGQGEVVFGGRVAVQTQSCNSSAMPPIQGETLCENYI